MKWSNWSASLADVDFITALGRLLRDGELRDAFAANPTATVETLGLRASDHALFFQLQPADLEFQARVLLRKRFDPIRQVLPRTCAQLEEHGWTEFQRYGRTSPPAKGNPIAEDATRFCQHLLRVTPGAVWTVEYNRARFARSSRKCACYFVRAIPFRQKTFPGLQLFLRSRAPRWHEWLFHCGV